MTFTTLRLTAASAIPLFDGHVRRLGEDARGALQHFASLAAEGIYRVWWDGRQLTTQLRGPSRLKDGVGVRRVVSPVAAAHGRFPKPAAPCVYDLVRGGDEVSLLTDARGEVLFEADSAALVAWDGAELVLSPDEVPAVASVSEAEVALRLPHRRALITVSAGWPLLLINAVVGSCAPAGCGEFPVEWRRRIDEVLHAD